MPQQTALSQQIHPQNNQPDFAALVAIDWADRVHFWSLRTPQGRIERGSLDNRPEAIDAWATALNARFHGLPVAVALEQRKGPLVVQLMKYAQHLHLYPVHPMTLARQRESWFPSGSKSDPKDSDLLLDILDKHRDRLYPVAPETDDMRLLQTLVENRRSLVDERVALTNRLESVLKVHFPQVPEWFDNLASPIVRNLLTRWPVLRDLQRARTTTLAGFLRQNHWSDEEKIRIWIEKVRAAVSATADQVVLTANVAMAAVWLNQIAGLHEGITALGKSIDELARRQDDWALFSSLPGAGPVLAPRLMAAFGTNRERFRDAGHLQAFTGIAPVRQASGNSVSVRFRIACPHFLRQTFHEWAAHSVAKSAWAGEYYRERKAKGHRHNVIVRALAFKWIRILFRCWQDRQPYREDLYLLNRAQRLVPTAGLCKTL